MRKRWQTKQAHEQVVEKLEQHERRVDGMKSRLDRLQAEAGLATGRRRRP